MTRTLPILILAKLLVGASLLAQTAAPDAQPRPCGGSGNIGGPLNNPFTARRVDIPLDASSVPGKPVMEPDQVARDSSGRIRIERRGVRKFPAGRTQETLYTRDGDKWTVTEEEAGILINLFNCTKAITIQPHMRMALVVERRTSPAPAADHPYSNYYLPPPRSKPNPAFLAEDLGYKHIEGLSARGIRTTILGTEDDEWKGKPTRVTEVWVSDELEAVLISESHDLKKGIGGITKLVDIKRVEPDSSLFEIPAGYRVNPTPSEMPYQTSDGKPLPAQPKQ